MSPSSSMRINNWPRLLAIKVITCLVNILFHNPMNLFVASGSHIHFTHAYYDTISSLVVFFSLDFTMLDL